MKQKMNHEEINKILNWFPENINETGKPLGRMIKKNKREYINYQH